MVAMMVIISVEVYYRFGRLVIGLKVIRLLEAVMKHLAGDTSIWALNIKVLDSL
ncbi:MAG: hypothetical protein WA131_12580 [Desulfitobacteriaceae bacterium]